MQDRKPQDQDKFIVRLPEGMRDRIRTAAEANNRSMNAEIVAALEAAFPAPFTRKSIAEAAAESMTINAELERVVSRWLNMRRQAHSYSGDEE